MTSQKLTEVIELARKAGSVAASDWDSDGPITIDDHRLRSLMNYERDVVQSSADDKNALPQWNAFLEAFDDEAHTSSISMDAARGKRFYRAFATLCDALDSLESMISLFPHSNGLGKGEIEPEIAIRGALSVCSPITSLMLSMINSEEGRNDYPGLLRDLRIAKESL